MSELATLMSRDPLELTRADITTIIETFRKSRGAFKLGNPKAGSTKPLTEKQQKVASLAAKLDIKL